MEHLSIVIRCKNEERSIGRTLEKIRSQNIGIPFEIVVVDSGSTDRTLEIAREFTSYVYQIAPETFTFGYALNFGIERATGGIIVNLSAHCIPTDDSWLSELVDPILKSDSDATFGRQVPVSGLNPFEEVSLYKHFPAEEKAGGRVPFSNANCAFLRKMWEEVRFDNNLPSWEDYLWHILLKDRFRFRYCPKAAVYHSHPFSVRDIKRRYFNDGRAFKMFQSNYSIDLFREVCPTLPAKMKMFFEDLARHARFFRTNGYSRYIPLAPVVRFLAYKAYWEGYNSAM